MNLTFKGYALLDEWISGRHAVIQRHYKRGHWQQLDKLIYEHNYRMNDLSHWPFDGACIFADGNCACFLGSLKAAFARVSVPFWTGGDCGGELMRAGPVEHARRS